MREGVAALSPVVLSAFRRWRARFVDLGRYADERESAAAAETFIAKVAH